MCRRLSVYGALFGQTLAATPGTRASQQLHLIRGLSLLHALKSLAAQKQHTPLNLVEPRRRQNRPSIILDLTFLLTADAHSFIEDRHGRFL